MGTVGNILIGGGTLVVDEGLVGEVSIGFTRDGVTVTPSVEHYIVDNLDQIVGAVKAKKVNERINLSTSMSEFSLANIKVAWDILHAIGSSSKKSLRFGGRGTGDVVGKVTEHTLTFYGIAPGDFARKIYFGKVIAIEPGESVMQKGEETVIPVTFTALLYGIGGTYPDGTYGYFEDNLS